MKVSGTPGTLLPSFQVGKRRSKRNWRKHCATRATSRFHESNMSDKPEDNLPDFILKKDLENETVDVYTTAPLDEKDQAILRNLNTYKKQLPWNDPKRREINMAQQWHELLQRTGVKIDSDEGTMTGPPEGVEEIQEWFKNKNH